MARSLYVRRRTVIHPGIVRCCGESGSSAIGAISSAARQFFQSWERRPEESISPMQLRPVNFPVESCQLLTQNEILCRERRSGRDQAPDEKKRAEMRTISVKQTIGI